LSSLSKVKVLAVLMVFILAGSISAVTIPLSDSPTEVKLLDQESNGLVMQVNIGSVNLETILNDNGEFTELTVDGLIRSQEIGNPNLPKANKMLSIPFGCDLTASVISSEITEIDLSDYGFISQLIPVQPSLSKSESAEDVPFEHNFATYLSDDYYHEAVAGIEVLGTMRSVNLGRVSVAPFEYNPVQNILRVYTKLEIRIDYINPDWAKTDLMQQKYYSPAYETVYRKTFNYAESTPTISEDLVTYPIKYVIVSDRMFEDQLQPFIAWKIKKGFIVEVAYTDDIGGSSNQIKNYIQGIYESSNPPADPAPSFVLFVGDSGEIPPFSGTAGSHVSDMYFCEFTGDIFPEIYHGRWSAQNPAELQPQIDKTLQYEQYTMPDPSFLERVTLISGVDASWAPTHGNGQINYGTNNYFDAAHGIDPNVWLYPASDAPSAAGEIIQTVQDGIGFINYTAHCGHDGFSDPPFRTGDVYALNNANMYPLGIGNCCLSNTFEESTPCFGEAWLQVPNAGGVGYIGGTNSTYWDEDYWWGVGNGPVIGNGPAYEQTGIGAYDGLFHDHGEDISLHYITNDAIIFAGNMAVSEAGGSETYYWEIYMLMGDPSVMTYLGEPEPNNVSYADAVMMTAPFISVTARPGSYVGVSMEGVLYGAGYVGTSGNVEVQLITQFPQPGTADIVISAQNYIPHISTITVTAPEGCYVVFDSCAVNDAAGNNDGMIDFGEDIMLDMQLANVGPDVANNVTAILTSDDDYVAISDGDQTFGTIQGDFGTVTIEDAFAFEVELDIPDGHLITFDLEITDGTDTWISHFNLSVHAPMINFTDVMINDDSGNGNGIFEAGETIDVVVTVANNGSSMATDVTAQISSSDEYIAIDDADATYGDIGGGESSSNLSNAYVVTAEADYPPGHSVVFDLTLTSANGYSNDFQFIIRAMESFEYNDGNYTGNASWQWGAPTSGPGSAFNGDNVWATNLGGEYSNGADDELITPAFSITSTQASYSFYQWYDFESGWDGGNVQVSLDGGASWSVITPLSGYPDADVTGLDNEPGFSGPGGAWDQVEFDLSSYYDETIKLKFRFGSDGSVTREGWYIDGVVLTGGINWGSMSPSMTHSPSSFEVSLDPGQSQTFDLNIANGGPGILEFTASTLTDDLLSLDEVDDNIFVEDAQVEKYKENGLSYYNYIGEKFESQDGNNGGLVTDVGGPDGFGYRWTDSNENGGPEFSWVDITSIGTPIDGLGDDTNVGPFDFGFDFPFYENTFTAFNFCTNGFATFTSSVTDYSNETIPTGDEPFNLLAVFWDDQDFGDGGSAYYYTNGTDSVVISWIDVAHYSEGGPYTYQIILLGDGTIVYQYELVNEPSNSNTIGIQNGDGSDGLQVVFETPYIQSGMAVQFNYPAFWLTVSPSGGVLYPDEDTDVSVTFDASEVGEGTYTGSVVLMTNDPVNDYVEIPCVLHVGPVGIDDNDTPIPQVFHLNQNYPNPFNPTTEIAFGLPTGGHTTLEVYDIMGRKVTTLIDKYLSAGTHQVTWNGSQISSGVYFYKLVQGNSEITKKMMMVK